MSHLPDDLEREMSLRSSITTALSNVYGPKQWDATLAILAEGEPDDTDRPTYADGEPDGLSLREIGEELGGLSPERTRQIILTAFGKLRMLPIVREMFYGYRGWVECVEDHAQLIDKAIAKADATQRQSEEKK